MNKKEIIEELNKRINEDISRNHQPNPYTASGYTCYIVSKDGEVTESSSLQSLADADWGIVKAYYAALNCRNYYDRHEIFYYVSPDGTFQTQNVHIEGWVISFGWNNGWYIFAAKHGSDLFLRIQGDSLLNLLTKLVNNLPLIHDCTIQEDVDTILGQVNLDKRMTKLDLIKTLLKENKLLKNKIEKIRHTLDE